MGLVLKPGGCTYQFRWKKTFEQVIVRTACEVRIMKVYTREEKLSCTCHNPPSPINPPIIPPGNNAPGDKIIPFPGSGIRYR
jgi:hypothetical protein